MFEKHHWQLSDTPRIGFIAWELGAGSLLLFLLLHSNSDWDQLTVLVKLHMVIFAFCAFPSGYV